MSKIKARTVTLVIPADTLLLGLFYVREINNKGKKYDAADSEVFLMPGIDGIDLTTNNTYKLNDKQMWQKAESLLKLSDEEYNILKNDINEEGAPSTEETNDADVNN